MTHFPDPPSLPATHSRLVVEAWATATVRCVLVPRGAEVDVELRNAAGVPFLRKTAPNRQAAKNEAAVLRLYVGDDRRPRTWRGLKPFALVVEDSADRPRRCAEVLRAIGMRVLTVASARDAAAIAREVIPDLVMLDSSSPDVSGLELCRQLRASPETADVPLVFVTAHPETIQKGDLYAPDVVLAQPCAFDTLMTTARLLLRDLIATEPAASPL